MIKYRYSPLKKKWLIFSTYCPFFIFANSCKVNSLNYFLTHVSQVKNKIKDQDSLRHRSLSSAAKIIRGKIISSYALFTLSERPAQNWPTAFPTKMTLHS